ncbi:MAG: serine hydrolase, partial [Kofleriaceae bacterium]
QDYGYLYWHRMYKTPCGTASGWSMGGNGGNSIVVFAELDAVVVVTRTAYNTKGMHQATAALIEDAILPELACKK